MDYIVYNGELSKRETIAIDIEDRGYQFGDGIYEVIRIYNGKLFAWEGHIERLFASAKKIRLEIPYTWGQLKKILEDLIAKNNLVTGTVYLQFSRGVSPRKHAFPGTEILPTFVAYTRDSERPVKQMETGVETWIVEDKRWLHCDIKSLNLLGNILAYEDAHKEGCYEAILNRGGKITEGSHTNVAIIVDGVLITHPANNLILNGITRQIILKLCEQLSIPVKEREFTPKELIEADEVFLTSTTLEITPVVKVNGQVIGKGPFLITQKLQAAFRAEIENECGSLS